MNTDPVQAALAAGFQALLRGDTKERDRQVERAQILLDAQKKIPSVDLSNQEIVERLIKLISAKIGRPLLPTEDRAIRSNPAFFMKQMIAEGIAP